MPYLTDLKGRIKNRFFSRISTREDFSDDNLTQAIRRALLEYSEFRPRRNVSATISTVIGQSYISLPSNFLSATTGALYTAKTGIPTSIYNYFRISSLDSVLHGTSYYPTWDKVTIPVTYTVAVSTSQKVELTQLDTGNFGIILDTPATAVESRTFVYDAFHEISDSPDKCTVNSSDMHNIEDLAIAFLLEGLSRDALLSIRTMESSSKSYIGEDYAKISDALIRSVRQSMASFGA